jgi:hypothetical protein
LGYKNRVIRIDFPDLSDEDDPIFVIIRNPKLMPAAELSSYADKVSGDATTTASSRDMDAAYAMFARLVVAWRVYDATAVPELDEAGNATGTEELLPLPATAKQIAKLPLEIIERLGQELGKVSPATSRERGTSTKS